MPRIPQILLVQDGNGGTSATQVPSATPPANNPAPPADAPPVDAGEVQTPADSRVAAAIRRSESGKNRQQIENLVSFATQQQRQLMAAQLLLQSAGVDPALVEETLALVPEELAQRTAEAARLNAARSRTSYNLPNAAIGAHPAFPVYTQVPAPPVNPNQPPPPLQEFSRPSAVIPASDLDALNQRIASLETALKQATESTGRMTLELFRRDAIADAGGPVIEEMVTGNTPDEIRDSVARARAAHIRYFSGTTNAAPGVQPPVPGAPQPAIPRTQPAPVPAPVAAAPAVAAPSVIRPGASSSIPFADGDPADALANMTGSERMAHFRANRPALLRRAAELAKQTLTGGENPLYAPPAV